MPSTSTEACCRFYLLTDVEGGEENKLPQVIQRNIVGPMMYEVGSGLTDDNIDSLVKYDFTKVIVITKDHERAITRLWDKIGVPQAFRGVDPNADWVLTCRDADRNPYIIFNIHSLDRFDTITKQLKTTGAIDRENPIIRIAH